MSSERTEHSLSKALLLVKLYAPSASLSHFLWILLLDDVINRWIVDLLLPLLITIVGKT